MIRSEDNLLLQCLCDPKIINELTIPEWELLVRLARQTKLLAYLSYQIESNGLLSLVPGQAIKHIESFQNLAAFRNRLAMWELNRIRREIHDLDFEVLVLKGGAYHLQKLDFAKTRLLSDIDILVRKSDIKKIENHLVEKGWQTAKLDEYDQYYYRTWMHEIPPLRHKDRYIEVDIHHTILPLTSRLNPSPELLLAQSVICKDTGFSVLSPLDMILHSSVHLFYNSELNESDLRDLVDLNELIIFYQKMDDHFFENLIERAKELTLQRPLYYTLYFTKKLLKTPIPETYINQYNDKPSFLTRAIMQYLIPIALLPGNPEKHRKIVSFSRWLLYIRSHYIKMPLFLLVPHLWKKSQKRLDENFF